MKTKKERAEFIGRRLDELYPSVDEALFWKLIASAEKFSEHPHWQAAPTHRSKQRCRIQPRHTLATLAISFRKAMECHPTARRG